MGENIALSGNFAYRSTKERLNFSVYNFFRSEELPLYVQRRNPGESFLLQPQVGMEMHLEAIA